MPRTRLLLFDIDGTLLTVDHGLGRTIVAEILFEELGFQGTVDGFDYHGKTDRGIMRELATIAGWGEAGDHIGAMEDALLRKWESRLAAAHVTLLPGVLSLLLELSARPDIYLALVTGNLERAARMKLDPVALNGYFPIGAFGSDHENRRMLPPLALQRASVHYGRDFRPERAVVIGDSHRDIDCARASGIPSIAVATGVLSRDELATHDPDLLLDSLTDIDTFLDFVDKTA